MKQQDSPYYKAILWAVESGIAMGTTESNFSPNAACSRSQILTFLYRAAGSPDVSTVGNPFADVADGAYYANAVRWAVSKGITNGTTAATFSPSAKCTRAQVITFLYHQFGK